MTSVGHNNTTYLYSLESIVRLFDHPRRPDYAKEALRQARQLFPDHHDLISSIKSIGWVQPCIPLGKLGFLQRTFIAQKQIDVKVQQVFANKKVNVELVGKVSNEHRIPLDLLRLDSLDELTLNVLETAAQQGDLKAISSLIGMRANVNYANPEFQHFQPPALFVAATSPNLNEQMKLKTVSLLLEKRANPYLRESVTDDCYWSSAIDYSKIPISVFEMIMESDVARDLRHQAARINQKYRSLMCGFCISRVQTDTTKMLWVTRFASYDFKCDNSELPLRDYVGEPMKETADQINRTLDKAIAFREREFKIAEDERQTMDCYAKPQSKVLEGLEVFKSWPIVLINLVKQHLFETEQQVSNRVARFCIAYFEAEAKAIG